MSPRWDTPLPLASLKEALAIDDIIIVQLPDEAKDLLKEGMSEQENLPLVSGQLLRVRLWHLTRIPGGCWHWLADMIIRYLNLIGLLRQGVSPALLSAICLFSGSGYGLFPDHPYSRCPSGTGSGRASQNETGQLHQKIMAHRLCAWNRKITI